MTYRTGLIAAITILLVGSGLISLLQVDRINADFVAYAEIAHRSMNSPPTAVTGSWSPLFPWLMIPLLQIGVDDLIAGRIVLVLSGILYICAIHHLAFKVFPPDMPVNRSMMRAMMMCATLQAIWFSTYLLDPDLLACAFLFWYFVMILDPRTANNSWRSFIAGIIAGIAYLAKAYMLPFCVAQFVVVFLADRICQLRGRRMPQQSQGFVEVIWMAVGLAIIVGPWACMLTAKYGHLTFTNAGRANHANVGPDNFGHDPLWHPPLTPDYIMEPVMATPWSPLASVRNFWHQMRLILHNTLNCLGLIPGWLALFFLALGWRLFRNSAVGDSQNLIPSWVALTVAIYCSGYVTVNLETRYVVPVLAPLLCLGAGVMIREIILEQFVRPQDQSLEDKRYAVNKKIVSIMPVVVIVLFGAVDIYSIACVAVRHPQTEPMARYRFVAQQLQATGCAHLPMASSRYHDGLYVAYANRSGPQYFGEPQSRTLAGLSEEMNSSGVVVFLRWSRDHGVVDHQPALEHDPRSWKHITTIRGTPLESQIIDVFLKRGSRSPEHRQKCRELRGSRSIGLAANDQYHRTR